MKTKSVTFRISEELYEKLRAAAEKQNRSISNYLENLIIDATK